MAGTFTLPETTIEGAPPAPANEGVQAISPTPGLVAVVDTNGEVSQVRREDANTAFQQGLRPASQAEFDAQDMGTGGQIASGLIGMGRGLSFGLTDAAVVGGARALGGDQEAEAYRNALNRAKAANPDADLGGELAGSLGGMFLLPGGAAKGAAAGEGLLSRAALRFASAAPRAAFEGGAIGLGHQISEDALGNHDATAEKYVASFGGGFVLGGLLGGALHAGGGALADKAGAFYGRLAGAGETAGSSVYRTAARAAEEGTEKEASPFMSWLREKVTGEAEEQAFKATGAKISAIEKLGATEEAQTERIRRIGRRLLDDEIVTGTASQREIAQRLTAKTREAGEELAALRGGLDKATARPSAVSIAEAFERDVAMPAIALPGGEREIRGADRFLRDMVNKGGETPSFEFLYKSRRKLDDLIYDIGIPKTERKAYGALRGIVEGEFEAAGERAAKELGGSFGAEYRLAKDAYSDLRTAEKIIVKEVARGGASRSVSLSDTIAGGAGLVAGGGLGSVAAALGNKVLRTYGNQAAADALNRVSRLRMLQRSNAEVDTQISEGVRSFLSGAKSAAPSPPKVTSATIDAVREATRDPAALSARVATMLGGRGLAQSAPRVSQAAATTAMRISAYLRDKAPKDPAPTGVVFVQQAPRQGSATERAQFAEAVEVANNPTTVVDDLRRGRVSREKVDALKNCYPQLYQQLRTEIASRSAEMRPNLTQQQEIALSVLFDVPVSAIMQPQNIRAFNESYAQAGHAEQEQAQQQRQQGAAPMQAGKGLQRKNSLASAWDEKET